MCYDGFGSKDSKKKRKISNFARKILDMTKLYLVRHGETLDNVNQIMQGQTQGMLTEAGRQQALQLCERFRNEAIDAFVASDLRRSVDTCAIIAQPHGKEVVQTPLLRERDWGDFTGRFIPDLKGLDFPENVESLDALKQRAAEFLDFIRKRFPDQTVLAVGHGIINKAIQAVYYQKRMPDIPRMMNAECRTLVL